VTGTHEALPKEKKEENKMKAQTPQQHLEEILSMTGLMEYLKSHNITNIKK